MLIIKTKETDIFRNLAKEEFLLDSKAIPLPALFLWQSSSAVVIGKHQNPWQECLVDKLVSDAIPLARRISGGGTVFHDIGNLNFTLITDKNVYNAELVYQMIFNALAKFGLTGQVQQKSNLCVDEKKFSGNAFAFRKKRAMHHGTLLIDADLEKLRYYLKPNYDSIETKAIASTPASVVNLSDINPAITIETLSEAIEQNFKDLFASEKKIIRWDDIDLDSNSINKKAKLLQTDEWIFGKTPAFSVTLNGVKHLIPQGHCQSSQIFP